MVVVVVVIVLLRCSCCDRTCMGMCLYFLGALVGQSSILICSTLDSIVCDEVQDILDVIEGDFMSKRKKDCSLFLLQQNLLLMLSEEVIIFTEAHGQEVKEISDVNIVSE